MAVNKPFFSRDVGVAGRPDLVALLRACASPGVETPPAGPDSGRARAAKLPTPGAAWGACGPEGTSDQHRNFGLRPLFSTQGAISPGAPVQEEGCSLRRPPSPPRTITLSLGYAASADACF